MADLSVKLKLNNSEYNQGIDSAKQKTKEFQSQADDTTKSLNDLDKKGGRSAKDLLSEMSKLEGGARSVSNYSRQLAGLQKQISDLTVNYRAMSSEMQNSDLGRETILKIQELTKEAANYKDAILDAKASVTALASDTANWDAMKQGIDMVSGALQGLASAGILGKNTTDDLVKVIAQLKAIESATNAVIKIGNALQKQSALMMGISRVQSTALAAAKKAEAAATGKATVAQKLFNTVAKANPYVLLASAIVAIITGLVLFTKRTKEAAKAQEEENKALEEGKKRFEEYKNKVGSAVGNVVGQFTILQKQYRTLKTEAEQQQWIDKNQSAFKSLGIEVHNVNDAYRVFIEQADDVIAALKDIAATEAIEDLYKEAIVESTKAQHQLEKATTEAEKNKRIEAGKTVKYNKKLLEDMKAAGLGEKATQLGVTGGMGGNVIFTDAEAKKMNDYYKKIATESSKIQVDEAQKTLDILDGMYTNAIRKRADAEHTLATIGGTPTNNTGGSKPDPKYVNEIKLLEEENKKLKDQQNFVDHLSDKWKEYENQIQANIDRIEELKQAEEGWRLRQKGLPQIEALKPIQGKAQISQKETITMPVRYSPEQMADAYNDAAKQASKYTEWVKLGIISKEQAQLAVDSLNDMLADMGVTVPVSLEFDDKGSEQIEAVQSRLSTVMEKINTVGSVAQSIVGSFNAVYEAFDKLNDKLEDAENGWESFMAVFETSMTVFQSVANIIEAVATVTELLGLAKNMAVNATNKETGALIANTAASVANTDAKIGEGAATGLNAATKGAESVASIPYVGAFIAAAMLGVIMGMVIGAVMSAKKFAGGGIFSSASKYGDHGLARLNDGEMVLNGKQQANLFKLLDEGFTERKSSGTGKVEFVIHGSDLVGIQKNYNKKMSNI